VAYLSRKLLFIVNESEFFLSHRLPIALAAKDHGFEIHVATPSDPINELKIKNYGFIFHQLNFKRHGINPIADLFFIKSIYDLLNKISPDIVHLITIKPALYGAIAAKFARISNVVVAITGMGYVFSSNKLSAKFLKLIVRKIYKYSLSSKYLKVIFQNNFDRDYFLNLGIINEDQSVLIRGSGVSLQEYCPDSEKSFVSAKPVILLASRMLWDKGVGVYVDAARLLKEQGFSYEFILAGAVDAGNPGAISRIQLEKWKKLGYVNWIGKCDDIPNLMKRVDVVCLPTVYGEGVPKVLIEAAATGLPIIASDSPGCSDIVIDSENGFLIDPRSSAKLAEAIVNLAKNPSLRASMGKRSREIAEKNFSVEMVISKTLAIYDEMLRHQKKQKIKSIAIIGSQAFSLINFRGHLISSLVKSGLRVYCFAPDFSREYWIKLKQMGAIPVNYSLQRVGINPLRDIVDIYKLVVQLRNLRVDATLTYFIKPVIYGTLAAYLAGIKNRFAIIEGLGYLFTQTHARFKVIFWAVRKITKYMFFLSLKIISKIVVLNLDDKNDLKNMGLNKSTETLVLSGIGVDLNVFKKSQPRCQPVTFILVARMLREKGIFDYIGAAEMISKKYKNTRFILVGGTDLNPGSLSEAQLIKWRNDGIVEWYGHVENVCDYLTQSSVFVLPSYREGYPRSTQEAMAVGRAIITTDVPGCRDTVIDGINGFLIPPLNKLALANAMEKFILNPQLIISMGEASYSRAVHEFNVENVNKKLINFLMDAC
jgi:glycosyltransferase involved in cell wall biosynthesis